jgi:hypothetical protein
MRLVAVLVGVLAVCAAALVVTVYDYARQGSATAASKLAPRTPAIAAAASPAPSPSDPGLTAPSPSIAGLPDGTGAAGGPVAVAPQSEAPAVSGEPDATAAPAGREGRRAKSHGGGHGKHDHPDGG